METVKLLMRSSGDYIMRPPVGLRAFHLTNPLFFPVAFFAFFSRSQLTMLDSGLEGATLAGLTALLGLAQAYLFQKQRNSGARLLNLTTGYFVGHFLAAIVFFCVWKIPSSLTWRHVAFRLLLECAWVEGMAIVVSV